MQTYRIRLVAASVALTLSGAAFAAGGANRAMPSGSMHTAPAAAQSTPRATPAAAGGTTTMHGPTHPTGQPNQSCGSATAPNTPGNAATAPGSAFNPDGKAGTVYAGEQPQNSRNTASVSQYDAACAHQH